MKLIIMVKHGSSDRSTAGGKKQRKSVTLEEKLDMIKKANIMNTQLV
jgi:hypothetical protein